MEMAAIVEYLHESGYLFQLINNPMAQFGPFPGRFLGAQFLPEQTRPLNEYTEEAIQYRTVVANDGTRYGPVQKKKSMLTGSMRVSLGHQDIGDDLTASDYDAILRLLRQADQLDGNGPGMSAVMQMLQWVDRALVLPLKVKAEKDRWAALLHAQVVRTGDDGYTETVGYPNPSGHRVTAGGQWSSNTYDPYTDIMPIVEFLRGLGYEVTRIVTDTPTTSKLALNAKMQARAGRVGVSLSSGLTSVSAGRATMNDLNTIFGRDGLPPIERYDLQYRTQTTTGYYFDRNTMFFACTTGRDTAIDRGDQQPLLLSDTIGYQAIGTAGGQSAPGPVIKLFPREEKPVRVEGEGYQASLPVVQDPEAIAVISGIS